MPAISKQLKLFVIMPVAAIAAAVALIAATETASAFPRGGGLRPMMAHPHVRPANVEATVKVLDGRAMHRPRGTMSNVEYTVTVTDTQSGRVNRPLVRSRNAAAGDPSNWEMTVKVLNSPSPVWVRPGKFRVIEREMLD